MKDDLNRADHQSAVYLWIKAFNLTVLAVLSLSGLVWADDDNGSVWPGDNDHLAFKIIDNDESSENSIISLIPRTQDGAQSCGLKSLSMDSAGVITLTVNDCPNETDHDGDGVLNENDNCRKKRNNDQIDTDGDRLGDVCDPDQDGDGVANTADNCPLNSNSNQANMDSDNLGDVCDPDQDGDGVANTADNCPLNSNSNQANMDSDSLGDVCDSDQDGDDVANTDDAFPSDRNEWADPDGDGIGSNTDNCPSRPNRGQVNTDGDDQGNACDEDDDNDGKSDLWEYQHGFNPLSPNETRQEEIDFDNDGYSDRDEFDAGTDPRDPDDHIQAILPIKIKDGNWKNIITTKHGESIIIANDITRRKTSDIPHSVIFAGPPSLTPTSKTGVILNKTDTSIRETTNGDKTTSNSFFDIKIGDNDNNFAPLMALQEGRHKMSDGSIWEVGTFTTEASGPVRFEASFTGKPHVFLTVQTTEAVTVGVKEIETNQFTPVLPDNPPQSVGYLAIFSKNGSGEIEIQGKKVPYVLQSIEIDDSDSNSDSPVPPPPAPVLNSILNVQYDTDYQVLGIGTALFAQASRSGDDTTGLTQKAAAFPDKIEWGTVTGTGIEADWINVPLSRDYTKPVVVVDSVDPIRLRQALSGSFQIKIKPKQKVHYLVAEQGKHSIDKLKFEAGRVASSSDRVRAVTFADNDDFTPPVVFSSVMTAFGDGNVKTSATDVSPSGFNLAMDTKGHRLEVLGWIAIDKIEKFTAQEGRTVSILAVSDSKLSEYLKSSGDSPVILHGHDGHDETSKFLGQ